MPECDNCGAHVSERFAAVFAPEKDATSVGCCPRCPDMVRDATGRPREAKAERSTARLLTDD